MGFMDIDSHTFVSLYASLISGFNVDIKYIYIYMDITCEVRNVVCTKCTSTGVTIFSGFYTKQKFSAPFLVVLEQSQYKTLVKEPLQRS